MRIDVHNRTVGVNLLSNKKVAVCIWAPLCEKVELLLTNSEKRLTLAKQDLGYWYLETDLMKPGDLYKIILDEQKEFPDPASLSQPNGVHDSSQVIDVNDFKWDDCSWQNPQLHDYILYELHTGTFSNSGDFKGIEEKLDHLKGLGINAIEIMPIAQFPGDRNWGYDGVYPFAVQNSYGGVKGLQQLVNACHLKGMAVVLDVVYNHLGPEGNYLGAYGPFFTEKYKTPWGGAINFDDAWSDGVRQYFIENALMWFRDFHIDALRLDAVHAIKDFSAVHILKEIRLYTNALMKETGRTHYLITELDLNDTRFINPVDAGGYGMDAQWIDEFHHALRVTAGGDRNGYYEDFKGMEHLVKAYNDAYVYDGQYSPHRKRKFGIKAEQNEGHQFIVFSQNHDQVGNRMLGERTSQLMTFEMQKLMAGAVMLSPFIPMLFMGEEWSEPNPFLYFVSHTDPELAEAVRKGRKAEFAAFHAQGEAPDPMSIETFSQSKLQWHLLEVQPHQTMLKYYQELIRLRKTIPVLKTLYRKNTAAGADAAQNVLHLHRWLESQHLMCFMNFSKEEQMVEMPDHTNTWNQVLCSADMKWGGPVDNFNNVLIGKEVRLQPESILIFSS